MGSVLVNSGLHTLRQHCLELWGHCLSGCAGQPDTFEATYSFFLGRVRDRLHVCLCFSPVGPQFARRYTMHTSTCS